MNIEMHPKFTVKQIKELCEVSYEGDLNKMLVHYQHALNKAYKKCNLKQVSIFRREIKTIKEIIGGVEHDD